MAEYLLLPAFAIGLLFPLAYAFRCGLREKILFVFATYGGATVMVSLVTLAGLPLVILSNFMFPEMVQYDPRLSWLAVWTEIVFDYWDSLSLLLPVPLALLINRRYSRWFAAE